MSFPSLITQTQFITAIIFLYAVYSLIALYIFRRTFSHLMFAVVVAAMALNGGLSYYQSTLPPKPMISAGQLVRVTPIPGRRGYFFWRNSYLIETTSGRWATIDLPNVPIGTTLFVMTNADETQNLTTGPAFSSENKWRIVD